MTSDNQMVKRKLPSNILLDELDNFFKPHHKIEDC